MTDYSRGDYEDLPAGTTDLENNYSAPDLTAIASNDNSTYAEQTANNEIAIHQYKKTVTSQYTNILWSGKSSLAPSESPVILEVYNVTGTPAWEELDRDDSTAADTDFDLSYNNLATADYLDNGVITWRVYQSATAPGIPWTHSWLGSWNDYNDHGAGPGTFNLAKSMFGGDLTTQQGYSAATPYAVSSDGAAALMAANASNDLSDPGATWSFRFIFKTAASFSGNNPGAGSEDLYTNISGFAIWTQATGALQVSCGGAYNAHANTLSASTYYHLIGTFGGGTLVLYLNGTSTTINGLATPNASSKKFALFADGDLTQIWEAGHVIDHFDWLSGTALTSGQAAADYAAWAAA